MILLAVLNESEILSDNVDIDSVYRFFIIVKGCSELCIFLTCSAQEFDNWMAH